MVTKNQRESYDKPAVGTHSEMPDMLDLPNQKKINHRDGKSSTPRKIGFLIII